MLEHAVGEEHVVELRGGERQVARIAAHVMVVHPEVHRQPFCCEDGAERRIDSHYLIFLARGRDRPASPVAPHVEQECTWRGGKPQLGESGRHREADEMLVQVAADRRDDDGHDRISLSGRLAIASEGACCVAFGGGDAECIEE
jgi:hypothetical protein